MSLLKITHQMWRDHSFSQRSKAKKQKVQMGGGVLLCVWGEGSKFEKGWG